MTMLIRFLFRHIREGFKNIKRNGWMTFASISAVAITLMLVGVFLVLLLNVNEMVKKYENDVEIKIYVSLESTAEEQERLRELLTGIPDVDEVIYRTKDEELDLLLNSFEDPTFFENLREENPLNDVFVVTTKNPEDIVQVATQVQAFPYIDEVKYGEIIVKQLFAILKVSRNVGLAIIAGLLFTAMFLISNTIKMTIVSRQKEIEIMRLVGASNSFIRGPFFLEGFLLGVLGSIIPITTLLFGYQYLYKLIMPKFKIYSMNLLPFDPYAWYLAAILLGFGGCIGIWGSTVSVRKFLRKYV
jgi:cell division transport system permease protein